MAAPSIQHFSSQAPISIDEVNTLFFTNPGNINLHIMCDEMMVRAATKGLTGEEQKTIYDYWNTVSNDVNWHFQCLAQFNSLLGEVLKEGSNVLGAKEIFIKSKVNQGFTVADAKAEFAKAAQVRMNGFFEGKLAEFQGNYMSIKTPQERIAQEYTILLGRFKMMPTAKYYLEMELLAFGHGREELEKIEKCLSPLTLYERRVGEHFVQYSARPNTTLRDLEDKVTGELLLFTAVMSHNLV